MGRFSPIVGYCRGWLPSTLRRSGRTFHSAGGTMSSSSSSPQGKAPAREEAVAYLDMPEERRAPAKAHAAMLADTARRVALELPIGADVDDFRRVLAAESMP